METSYKNGQINITENYDLFKLRYDNRKIDQNHVIALVRLMEQSFDLHLHPIIVNAEMEVVDGQHRLEAAKMLHKPIYYLVDDNFYIHKIIDINTSQNSWKPDDYLNYWIAHGKEDYVMLSDFIRDVGLPLSIVLAWMSKTSENRRVDFKKGNFIFVIKRDPHEGRKILNSILHAKRLISFLKDKNFKPISALSSGQFHNACREFFMNPMVDAEHFFDKLDKISFTIAPSKQWTGYFDQFVEIYNYNQRKHRLKVTSDGNDRTIVIDKDQEALFAS